MKSWNIFYNILVLDWTSARRFWQIPQGCLSKCDKSADCKPKYIQSSYPWRNEGQGCLGVGSFGFSECTRRARTQSFCLSRQKTRLCDLTAPLSRRPIDFLKLLKNITDERTWLALHGDERKRNSQREKETDDCCWNNRVPRTAIVMPNIITVHANQVLNYQIAQTERTVVRGCSFHTTSL